MTVQELQQEALSRALHGQTMSNYPAIIQGFVSMGISLNEISPRENVFTFHAWKALGRKVKKGEHGVKIQTWVPMKKTVEKDGEKKEVTKTSPRFTTVFHVSQTEPI